MHAQSWDGGRGGGGGRELVPRIEVIYQKICPKNTILKSELTYLQMQTNGQVQALARTTLIQSIDTLYVNEHSLIFSQ